jgi:hypothetical protein
VKGHHRLSLLSVEDEDASRFGCGPDVDGGLKTFLVIISSLWVNAHS